MSLQLAVYYIDPVTKTEKNVPLEYDVFGFETARRGLWGAPVMRQLGVKLLSELRNGATLQVEGDDLNQLEHEAQVIIDNSELIYEDTGYGSDDMIISNYANNLLQAIRTARKVNGFVYI